MDYANNVKSVLSSTSGLTILITGANGFIGRALCKACIERGLQVRGALRALIPHDQSKKIEFIVVGEINEATDWSNALRKVDVVIHLAARVHVFREHVVEPLSEFHKVNVDGTKHLALSAVAHGVKRIVYVSSIGVNGVKTDPDKPFAESDVPAPCTPYAVSKWEAEQELLRIADQTGLEVVIVRPPLVYGKDAPGNFAQLPKLLARGIPLPLGSINNRRSFIYVENLVDALILCAIHHAVAGQTYLISDGEDISTSDLLRELNSAMGFPTLIFPFPLTLLKYAGRFAGKSMQIDQLVNSLRIDSRKIQRDLGWAPRFSVRQGLCLSVSKKHSE